jgi:hypothetical protein
VSVANLYLQQYKDVAFASRGEWEERLFAGFDCTRAAQDDYVKELDSVSKAREYHGLLMAEKFRDSELRILGDLRAPDRGLGARSGVQCKVRRHPQRRMGARGRMAQGASVKTELKLDPHKVFRDVSAQINVTVEKEA